jgi:hypothetical protein
VNRQEAILILKRSVRLLNAPQAGMRVVFELKKKVEEKNANQAMLTLLLANWHASG